MALPDTTSPAAGLVTVLAAANVTAGFEVGVSGFTTEPDQQIIFRDSGGGPSEVVVAVDYPAVQMLVRGKSSAGGYEAAYAMAIACRNALVAIPSGPAAWAQLTSVTPRGHIQDLGRDDQARPMFSFNMQLIVSYAGTSGWRETY